jgi:hypothetical protein
MFERSEGYAHLILLGSSDGFPLLQEQFMIEWTFLVEHSILNVVRRNHSDLQGRSVHRILIRMVHVGMPSKTESSRNFAATGSSRTTDAREGAKAERLNSTPRRGWIRALGPSQVEPTQSPSKTVGKALVSTRKLRYRPGGGPN